MTSIAQLIYLVLVQLVCVSNYQNARTQKPPKRRGDVAASGESRIQSGVQKNRSSTGFICVLGLPNDGIVGQLGSSANWPDVIFC